jgi:hypothetical protein
MDYGLCRRVDATVPESRWVASLSNGETIYENNRKDLLPAWERLGEYCRDHDLWVTNLRLQIAGHQEEVKLPSGQQGYIQKKIAWTVGGTIGGVRHCIGYVQNGLSLLYEVDVKRGSRTIRPGDDGYRGDPGEPWTIYRLDERKAHATSK